ncbi:MAG TPA: hypothetical protein VGD02_11665 [Gemmatimonadaceae bacterium]
MTYLGVSGLLIEHGGHALLTAPFFSNPRLGLVRPKVSRLLRRSPRISTDTQMVERWLPKSADAARVILVGHGHYDHLLDVPYIATHRARGALVYGSTTVRHILMGDETLRKDAGARVIAIPITDAGTRDSVGAWFYSPDSAFRFMALRADHAPTFRFLWESYTFAAGAVSSDLDSLPHTAPEWKLGEPFAFLIDVLDVSHTKVVFRMFFQDAPSQPPLGFPPISVVAERGIDLAVLCAATSSNVPYTPDSLLKALHPRAVLVTHWESFFRSQNLSPEVSRGLHLDQFLKSVTKTVGPSVPWRVPLPHAVLRFAESSPR